MYYLTTLLSSFVQVKKIGKIGATNKAAIAGTCEGECFASYLKTSGGGDATDLNLNRQAYNKFYSFSYPYTMQFTSVNAVGVHLNNKKPECCEGNSSVFSTA